MMKTHFTFLSLVLSSTVALSFPAMAQSMYGDMEAEAAAAKMNRDNYPYSVLARGPIYAPEERRKIRKNMQKAEAAAQASERNQLKQFRGMSADERRYVIETQGFPRGAMPGYGE